MTDINQIINQEIDRAYMHGSHEKVNKAYKVTHVLYPLFMVGAILYFLTTEVIK